LNLINTDLLENEIVFGLNRAYLKDDLPITYQVAVNLRVLYDYGKEIVDENVPTFISPIEELWKDNTYGLWFRPEVMFEGDVTLPIYQGHTVTYCALQLAYFMGFTDVALIGIDHNYPRAEGHATNLPILSEGEDTDHFHPEYFPEGATWETPNLARSEEAYQLAKDYFERDSRRIVNCSVSTKLDVFDKMRLEEWLRDSS
jgi:hypothetical protein